MRAPEGTSPAPDEPDEQRLHQKKKHKSKKYLDKNTLEWKDMKSVKDMEGSTLQQWSSDQWKLFTETNSRDLQTMNNLQICI